MAIYTLTGGEAQAGNAINNTQTDTFQVSGADNIVVGIGGNLNVVGGTFGGSPLDSNTTVILGSNPDPGSGVADTINVALDNGGNKVSTFLTTYTNSNITVTVGGSAGGNNVSLDNEGALATNTITLGGSGNDVTLNGALGTNTVTLGGSGSDVTLNGNATNTVSLGGGGADVQIGSFDDDDFGYKSTVTLAGDGNTVKGGDENFTITGGGSNNKIALVGDGNNSVTLTGTGNTISVWGGNNTLDAGGSGATVTIRGVDGDNAPSFDGGNDGPDDGPVPSAPLDVVTLRGSGDKVTGTYEDVTVLGLGITNTANIMLGDGNDVLLLGGTGGNTVTLGNGDDHVTASGNASTYNVGDGHNVFSLTGNANTIIVTDPTGVGNDKVNLNAGANNIVQLDHAGGSVKGTDTTGVTTVTQTGRNAVTVNLNGGTGNITLGDGNDTVTANGNGTTVNLGNGNDTVTANGNGTTVTAGNGNDTVTANGTTAKVTLGNGNDTVTANGNGATVTLGNGTDTTTAKGNGSTLTLGTGSNTVTATGSGDTITQTTLLTTSTDNFTIGSNSNVHVGSGVGAEGIFDLTALGAGDNVYLDGTAKGSVLNFDANGSGLFLGANAYASVHLNPTNIGDTITVQALTAAGSYTGTVKVYGFSTADTMDLQSLVGKNGLPLNSITNVLLNTTFGATADTIALKGGGQIAFESPTAFKTSSFMFTGGTGPF